MKIEDRILGTDHPTYIIAELSANHGQDFGRAVELVHAAVESGADAIKLQTYTADTITLESDQPWFQIDQGTVWDGQTLHRLYQQAYTPWEWQPKLKSVAEKMGVALFSSPFDFTAVDFLEEMDVPAYKIASFEIVDIPLLKKVASTNKPVILSTGMAELMEIELAVRTLGDHGTPSIALLKCTSAYPAPPESMNLRTLFDLAEQFGCVVGLSDHTLTHEAAIASVCLGGRVIEKHFTLSRSEVGPDSGFSLEPNEFAEMVRSIRNVEKALGTIQYGPTEFDQNNRNFRKSLFVTSDVRQGEKLSPDNVRSIRPGCGLEPKFFDDVIGQYATCDIPRGTPLSWDHIKTEVPAS